MKIDIKKVAKLANLPITSEEENKYSQQLSNILEYIEQLNEVDTNDVEATFNVSGRPNIMREDSVGESLNQKDALSNAPQTKNGFIATKGIFNNE